MKKPSRSKAGIATVLVVMLLTAAAWTALRVRAILRAGDHFAPFFVRVVGSQPSDFGIKVIGPWGAARDLVRTGGSWSDESGPVTVLEFSGSSAAARITAEWSVAGGGWHRVDAVEWRADVRDSRRWLATVHLPPGRSLFWLGRKTANWSGDFRLLIKAAARPLLVCGLPVCGLLAFPWLRRCWQGGANASPAAERGPGSRVDGLDALRGAAILIVFLYHCLYAAYQKDQLPWAQWHRTTAGVPWDFALFTPLTLGWSGVAIFFAVSGFCIATAWLRRPDEGWRGFSLRRAGRILPPYWLILIGFAVYFPSTRLSFESGDDAWQLLSHLLLVHNLDSNTYFGVNGSFWSIAVEVQLYLCFPLVVLLARRMGWGWALVMTAVPELALRGLAVCAAAGVAIPALAFGLWESPFNYWGSWTVGAWVASCVHAGRLCPLARIPAWLFFALVPVAWWIRVGNPFAFPLAAAGTAALIARMAAPGRSSVISTESRPWSLLASLGAISYSFYLIHQPIINLVGEAMRRSGVAAITGNLVVYGSCATALPLIWHLSRLSFRWIETPSMRVGADLARSRSGDGYRPAVARSVSKCS